MAAAVAAVAAAECPAVRTGAVARTPLVEAAAAVAAYFAQANIAAVAKGKPLMTTAAAVVAMRLGQKSAASVQLFPLARDAAVRYLSARTVAALQTTRWGATGTAVAAAAKPMAMLAAAAEEAEVVG